MSKKEEREIFLNAHSLTMAFIEGKEVDVELKNGFKNTGFVTSVSKKMRQGRKDYRFSFTQGGNLIFNCWSSQIKTIEKDI